MLYYNLDTLKVASKLFVYINTVLHLKNKIIEIPGYNPFEHDDLITFQISLVLRKLDEISESKFYKDTKDSGYRVTRSNAIDANKIQETEE